MELHKKSNVFYSDYEFTQNNFKDKKNWNYISQCRQFQLTFYNYGFVIFTSQYGEVYTSKDHPEMTEKITEKKEEEKNEELLNSIPFIREHIRILPKTYSSTHEIAIHFGHSEGPISPKDDGGYYLAYYNSKDTFLHILEFSSNDELENDFNTKYKAYPHDIATTSNGFVVYLVNSSNVDHSFLVSYDKKGTKLWEKIIMNNKNPKKKKKNPVNQIITPNKGFGMNCIFEATNAKLGLANDKIALIFAHYNNFDFKNDCHTGDTFCTFDLATGKKYDFALELEY